MRDRVIERPEGFYCVVNGREFGAWATEAMARGGMQVEQRRVQQRAVLEQEFGGLIGVG